MKGENFTLIIDEMVVAENIPFERIKNLTQWTKNIEGLRNVKLLIDGKYSFKYREDFDYSGDMNLYLFPFDIVLRECDLSKKEKWENKIKKRDSL